MDQTHALAILKSGKNVFLTGSAGTGKTYVLNQYISYLKERKVPVAVTASTGIAATHLNGMTIHAWSGMGVKDSLTSKDLQNLKTKKYLQKQLEASKVLVIDEISMLHKNQLDIVNRILQFFKGNELPFGGIQVVVSGDFFQLPPVGRPGEANRDKFAFMSEAWLKAGFAVCYLTEQYRQTDSELNDILNEIRASKVSLNSLKLLKEAEKTRMDWGWEPTKLYTHNHDVDRENRDHLQTLEGGIKVFEAKKKGNPKLLEVMTKSVLAQERLVLKEGAKVMFLKNNLEAGYFNGTLGKVTGFNQEGLPEVTTFDGNHIVAEPEKWSMDNDKGSSLASFEQIPLRLAWAITVHKSQGVTLQAAEIDLSKTFERGQGYVALSRLKEIKNLKLTGFNDTALEVDPLAYKADKRFQELSEEEESIMDLPRLELAARSFMQECGGLTSKSEIEKYKKRKKEKAGPKKSTYVITKEYIEEGKTIEEIAEARGMATTTITGHLLKIKEQFPDFDLERFKPQNDILIKVTEAYQKLVDQNQVKEDGTVSQKAMYELMNGQVGYNEIKLALLFVVD